MRSAADFIKQRRRWFIGLMLVATKAPTKWRYRLPIALSTAVWSVSWVGVAATYANFLVGVEIPFVVRILGNFAFAVYVLLYLAGMAVQLHLEDTRSRPTKWLHYAAVVLLIPVFSVLEGLGVIYAVASPDVTSFHVVKK